MASSELGARSALVERGYDAFQTGDMDALRSLFTSDIAWHSRSQGAGHFHGVDAVIAEFGRLHDDGFSTTTRTPRRLSGRSARPETARDQGVRYAALTRNRTASS